MGVNVLDNGAILTVSSKKDPIVVPVKQDGKTIEVSSGKKTVIDSNLWLQWTQQLPPIFQEALSAFDIGLRTYSDTLANALQSAMNTAISGINTSIQSDRDSNTQQFQVLTNNQNNLSGVVDTKISSADANAAIATAISSVLTQFDTVTAQIVQSYQVYVDENLSYDVNIYSSNGSMFRNRVIDTTLTAQILKGRNDITADIAPTKFSWIRVSNSPALDTVWNTAHEGYGKSVVITNTDVYGKAVFRCLVNLV